MEEDDKSLAQQIADGEICAFCMMPFEKDTGIPCACDECWEEGCGYEKSWVNLLQWDDEKPETQAKI
jgi:hypothetical protein